MNVKKYLELADIVLGVAEIQKVEEAVVDTWVRENLIIGGQDDEQRVRDPEVHDDA